MKALVEMLMGWVKHDTLYRIPNGIPVSALFSEVLKRGVMLCRGALLRPFLRGGAGIIFLGSGVHIRESRLLTLGRNISIHDGVYLDALSKKGVIIGDNVTIREHSVLECTAGLQNLAEGLIIGNNVCISQNCFIAARGLITIGNDVLFGSSVTLYSENHVFSDPETPIRNQGLSRLGITIEDDCWLGTGSKILDGVTIGRGSIVAAGAVVTKNAPAFSIVAGVPARVIRNRINYLQSK